MFFSFAYFCSYFKASSFRLLLKYLNYYGKHSLDKENMEKVAEKQMGERGKEKLLGQVQKRPNFYTNCSKINGLCILAAVRVFSFSLLKSCFVHANFCLIKSFPLKNARITFPFP